MKNTKDKNRTSPVSDAEKQLLQDIAKQVLTGKSILYPAESVWGLGCDATNPDAVEKIYQIKKRDAAKPMIVLVNSEQMLQDLVEVPEMAWEILDVTDSPLTLIYDNPKKLAPNILGEDGSIGIRLVKSGFAHELIKYFKKPLVSTSANLSGSKTPLHFDEIAPEIISASEITVRPEDFPSFKDAQTGKPSSIIRIWHDGRVKVIRE